ncbi:MAG: DNA-directed RNA polymerase subunit beta [Candidatus Adiutrix intracellularis]|jgi:DNA-directed RNA polymerase subunit beta|nr:DNA-directed RNA polymerase subunit beta [Candidatus Adiutrix intracellularis]
MPSRYRNLRIRKTFGKTDQIIDMPNLIEMQRGSYERFLQKDVPQDKRSLQGLQAVFKSVFPIRDFSGLANLEFLAYSFDEVKYEVDECLAKGMTYEAPLKIRVSLEVYDQDKDTGVKTIRGGVKEQEIYFGTLPLMTNKGTFIINGTERVIVSQLHRSPGIFFDHDKGKTHSSGKILYLARIIPMRGSWLDLEMDPKDIIYVRIDRRRKFPVTLLLKALGYTAQDLLDYFYEKDILRFKDGRVYRDVAPTLLIGQKVLAEILDPETGKALVRRGKKITKVAASRLEELGIRETEAVLDDFFGRYVARDVINPETGEVLIGLNEIFTEETYEALIAAGITELPLLFIDNSNISSSFRDTLTLDKVETTQEAVLEIYRKIRPSTPPTLEVAQAFFDNLFFNPEHYDLSPVGRLKLNLRLFGDQSQTGQAADLGVQVLRPLDILTAVKELVKLKDDPTSEVDDIDHLGNRRVRAVGELLENQYRMGLVRMERAIKERMSLQEVDTLMPHDLINSKPVSAVVKEFFGTSQLSQFMDQNNPLSEITHKRRLSALGPGGLTRDRAGFEVRDVHPTHYGRICPIETPEGPNIGLIVSLSTYARVNEYGFIETPYRKVENKRVTGEVRYLTALEEKDLPVAQANVKLDNDGHFLAEQVPCHVNGEFMLVPKEEVKLMDVSPNQLVSVAASLVPFLEHDDANRALMGSNMQRQAVPLLRTDAPLVGTGIESVVARDSEVTVVAKYDGVVEDADASRVVVRYTDREADKSGQWVNIYKLTKFQRTNQSTCFNQRPIVKPGDLVKKGQIIADGPSTEMGELALGRNVMVAFMTWGGYNFEDSILVSERLVKEDIFTSVHIEEFETVARDTKLGPEEITRDIPNLGEDSLANLDRAGIIRIGAEVRPGHILVGKITPKGETQLSPEEKLLRAIFGEKASDVKDTSLRVPPGVEGTIIDARVFYRKGVDKDERCQQIENDEIARLMKDQEDEIHIIIKNTQTRLAEYLEGKTLGGQVFDGHRNILVLKKKDIITAEVLDQISPSAWVGVQLVEDKAGAIAEEVGKVVAYYEEQVELIRLIFEKRVAKLKKGDEMPPGVIKMVKVYVAMKRKLSVGDKMAGRHGNKGVVSRILPEEDMPFFEDGTPVDLVLNPLGVPSRMNVGQIMETHLGWASRELGRQIGELVDQANQAALRQKLKRILGHADFERYCEDLSDEDLLELATRSANGLHMATPVFDGAEEVEIKAILNEAGLPDIGQTVLRDGRNGERFENEVTVGIMYMLKLHHLVDDKIHARSIGPYSLVTQQPLGGKAQFGGQRLGEMEVWAMEAYGAAYSLQEFLTVKSDDVAGRTRMYEKIVKGDNVLEAGLPESFNVLVKELQSLALDVDMKGDLPEEMTVEQANIAALPEPLAEVMSDSIATELA